METLVSVIGGALVLVGANICVVHVFFGAPAVF